MTQGYQYQPCVDCQQRILALQQLPYGQYQQTARVCCADGQDGLCSEHRFKRRQQQQEARPSWAEPVPEGQE